MKQEKRSRWWLLRCDGPSCTVETSVHESGTLPEGWEQIEAPYGWKGAPMIFCGKKHRADWIELNIVNPQIAEATEGVMA